MEKIEINHFKAFRSRIALIPTTAHKNVLIYGENGAGKTSLYEAIVMAFYREKLLKPHSRNTSYRFYYPDKQSGF